MSCQIATPQQLLVQRIKSNLDTIDPGWDDIEWWDSLLPNDNNDSCLLEKDEIDAISAADFDDLLKEEQDITPNSTLCKVETTTDYLDETSHLEWIDLDLNKVSRTHVNSIYIRGTLSFSGYRKYNVDCYVDTGASMCLANKHIIPPNFWVKAKIPIYAKLADDTVQEFDIVAEKIDILIQDKVFTIPSLYQTTSRYDILLGNNFCRLYEPFGQWGRIIALHNDGQIVVCPKLTTAYYQGKPGFLESKAYGSKTKAPPPETIAQNLDFDQNIMGEDTHQSLLAHELMCSLMNLSTIETKLDAVCSDNPLDLRISKQTFKASIRLSDPSTKIKVAPMQYTKEDREEFSKQIKELLDAKLIQPSKSPHFSPAFLVNKHSEQKRGKRRMVINYKKLNDHTIGDGYLLPRKDELLDQVRGKKVFSSFDCKSGFWQVLLDETSQSLTAFTCPQGHFEWKVMPFGLKQAPSIFQRHMNETFEGFENFCRVYVDDIIVFSENDKEHIEHVSQVLDRCKEVGVILSKPKAQLFREKIEFLGLIIDKGKLQLQKHIGENITAFNSKITDRKQLQRFLGILNYISQFCPKVAQIRQPLQAKLKKDAFWQWSDSDTAYVDKIKKAIKNLPPVHHPGPEEPLIIETDASDNYWGGILKAKQSDGLELICGYASGTFKPAEKNYHSNEKEILALINTIKRFQVFLIPVRFIARTDNKNVFYFLHTNIHGSYKQGRLVRWQLWLSYFDITFEHVAGTNNVFADFLSREFSE